MTTEADTFYGLLIREDRGWYTRSLIQIGRSRWEAVIGRHRGRAIEAAAAAHPELALRTAWRRVEHRLARGDDDG